MPGQRMCEFFTVGFRWKSIQLANPNLKLWSKSRSLLYKLQKFKMGGEFLWGRILLYMWMAVPTYNNHKDNHNHFHNHHHNNYTQLRENMEEVSSYTNNKHLQPVTTAAMTPWTWAMPEKVMIEPVPMQFPHHGMWVQKWRKYSCRETSSKLQHGAADSWLGKNQYNLTHSFLCNEICASNLND